MLHPVTPQVLSALRLPELLRDTLRFAGVAVSGGQLPTELCVIRSGVETPDIFAKLLEEAFLEDEAEVLVFQETDAVVYSDLLPGHFLVRPGFDFPCPVVEELRDPLDPAQGRVLVFGIERRDLKGHLLQITWAAMAEDEPPPEAGFRMAVIRQDCETGIGKTAANKMSF